jgi:hypothetical protein
MEETSHPGSNASRGNRLPIFLNPKVSFSRDHHWSPLSVTRVQNTLAGGNNCVSILKFKAALFE